MNHLPSIGINQWCKWNVFWLRHMTSLDSYPNIRVLTWKTCSWSHINDFFNVSSTMFNFFLVCHNLIKSTKNFRVNNGMIFFSLRQIRGGFFYRIIEHFPNRKTLWYESMIPHLKQKCACDRNIWMSKKPYMQKIYSIHRRQQWNPHGLNLGQKHILYQYIPKNFSNYSFDGTMWGKSVSLRLAASISKNTAPGILAYLYSSNAFLFIAGK